ncbi:MAG: hypothetical protein ISS17_07530 [Bacteroidales bacterium]|nr:hypothetical protein [Bacteroidales bacterium]
MKRIIFIIEILLVSFYSNGQFSGNILTQPSELTFSTKDGYDLIELADKQFTKEIGAPMIPIKTFKYVLPLEAEVTNIEIVNYSKQQITGLYYIYPVQPPHIPDGSPMPDFVPPSLDIYSSTDPYPGQTVEISEDTYVMGYKIVSVIFFPLEYIPVNKEIFLYSSMDFIINYTIGAGQIQLPNSMSSSRKKAVKEIIKILVDNDSDIENFSTQFNNIPEDGSSSGWEIIHTSIWFLCILAMMKRLGVFFFLLFSFYVVNEGTCQTWQRIYFPNTGISLGSY